jgi:hypothetical protein
MKIALSLVGNGRLVRYLPFGVTDEGVRDEQKRRTPFGFAQDKQGCDATCNILYG